MRFNTGNVESNNGEERELVGTFISKFHFLTCGLKD